MISGSSDKPGIGMPMTLYPVADCPSGQKHVLVVAAFGDGVHQIILDMYL
jgi:hypothetical protein